MPARSPALEALGGAIRSIRREKGLSQEALGFEPVACFREVGYKFGRWLDVTYLQLILAEEDSR